MNEVVDRIFPLGDRKIKLIRLEFKLIIKLF
jgi:hypothetical protein